MDSGAIVALITAGVSLLLSIGKIAWDSHEKTQQRTLDAREKLDRYRAPLLAAVDGLGVCLNNIRCQSFLAYFEDEDRRDAARNTVLFRLAQYFGWTEI